METTEEGTTAVTTIIPYKIGEDGTLINSFVYAEEHEEQVFTRSVNSHFVDVTVVTTAHYDVIPLLNLGINAYRTQGFDIKWTSSNSSASVSILYGKYQSRGTRLEYPKCTQVNNIDSAAMTGNMYGGDYMVTTYITQASPAKNVKYSDFYEGVMPYGECLACLDFADHGGMVRIDMTYTVNGTKRTEGVSYYPY